VYVQDDLRPRTDDPVFTVPKAAFAVYYGPVRFDSRIQEPLMTISVPLFNKAEGNVVGVLAADLRVKAVWNLLANIDTEGTAEVYVIDSGGLVVAHRNPAVVLRGTTVSLPGSTDRATGIRGTEVIAESADIRIGNRLFKVIAEMSVSEAQYLARRGLLTTAIVTLVAIAAAVMLVLASIRTIVVPLERLSRSARVVAEGDFSREISVPERHSPSQGGGGGHEDAYRNANEVEQLLNAFNAMVRALRARDEALQEQQESLKQARDELEDRVAERTMELISSNNTLQREIKERVRAEQELVRERDRAQGYLKVARVMFVLIDLQGRVVLINRKGCEILGYEESEVLGRDWFAGFVPEETRDSVRSVFDDLIAGKIESDTPFENTVITKSGERRTIAWQNTVLRDEKGRITGTLSSGEDVTERRRMEEELTRTQKLESLGIMAGGIAHDFNNLLVAVLGNLSLAMELRPADKVVQEMLLDAEKAGLQMKNLTQQLLTFSRGGAPIKKITPLAPLIRDAAGFALRGSSVRCTYSIPKDLWASELDTGQIGQVIHNVVINAIQATEKGGTIHIAAKNVELPEKNNVQLGPGRYVQLSVEDHGSGVRESDIDKVFDPYFTTKSAGSGLGLAISYSIVQKHGGSIILESEYLRGTVCSILLPASSSNKSPVRESKQRSGLLKGRVLIMDDEAAVRKVLGSMVERLGLTVGYAENGQAAIEEYENAQSKGIPYDLLIMDLTIPGGMGGQEAIKGLLELDPEVKVIVSSGYSEDPVMANYREFGFSGVLSKPFRMRELREVLWQITTGDKR
jgi:PAS domain S-box-containing protein